MWAKIGVLNMNRLKKQIDYAKFTENSIVTLDIDYAERLLLELTEQYETPTLEEVKKEWEECGYVWKETNKWILLDNNIEEKTIRIYKSFKLYHVKALGENYFEIVSFALHQLLTKTMKALGWL